MAKGKLGNLSLGLSAGAWLIFLGGVLTLLTALFGGMFSNVSWFGLSGAKGTGAIQFIALVQIIFAILFKGRITKYVASIIVLVGLVLSFLGVLIPNPNGTNTGILVVLLISYIITLIGAILWLVKKG
ncbi:hypothetical protein NPX79_00185 [Spiroplasma endosymbiont of Anurida maritima]|uniref:hypothetical protein n=1 Tax=Spiroplasma endosymbiont of Anurida maritima TaxID=2967972 RepID=UPI0036D3DEA2